LGPPFIYPNVGQIADRGLRPPEADGKKPHANWQPHIEGNVALTWRATAKDELAGGRCKMLLSKHKNFRGGPVRRSGLPLGPGLRALSFAGF